ncbi:MAG: hypothetical protein V1745_03125 [Patescibacteria group bacterium]
MPYSPEVLDEVVKAQDAFAWEIPSWEKRNRGPRWYIYMTGVTVLFLIYAVVTSNFLFAFLILLTAIILVLAGSEDPHRILVQIGKNGVVVDGHLYEFKDLSNFSIVYHPPETKVLYFDTRSVLKPHLRIPLDTQNPVEIRDHLKKYMEENLLLQEEHFSDIVARLLKI